MKAPVAAVECDLSTSGDWVETVMYCEALAMRPLGRGAIIRQ